MKRIISLILVLIFVCGTVAFAHPFNDVKGHWAEAEIEKGYINKSINGDPDGRFRPDDEITRGEFLKMLAADIASRFQMEISDEIGDGTHWASKYYSFAKAYLYEQPNLTADGIRPGAMASAGDYEKPIPRWEMAFMLSESINNTVGIGATAAYVSFADDDVLKAYPEKILADITNCYVLGLMKGDENGKFNPSDSGTRAEAVTVINRLGDIIQKELDAYTALIEEYNKQIEESLVTYDKIPTGHPIATIVMSNNKKIVVELYPEYAPQTVANFVKLAKEGFYNGLTFHRIVEGFVAQGGDPSGDGTGGSDAYIKGEFLANGFTQNTLKHTRGVISMARSNHPDSASSQFFICYDDAGMLDGQYAAFGKVKTGMEVVDAFTKVEMTTNSEGEPVSPKEPIVIKSITIK